MKYQCEMIQDLLPLYQDKVCSDASRQMVKEHLEECETCKGMEEKLKNTKVEDKLQTEKEGVIEHHTKQMKKKTFVAGTCMAGILTIPIIVCLICNIAIGHALDWFFIVLTSLLVVASLTVLPLMVEEKRGLWTLAGFTASLLLLLYTCCMYSGSTWFFIAAVPVLLGLSVVFLPYVLYSIPLPGVMKRNKGLVCMLADTVLLYAVIFTAGFYVNDPAGYFGNAFAITTVSVVYPWGMFLMIRYLKVNGYFIAALGAVFSGIFNAFLNDVINWILYGTRMITLSNANLMSWRYDTINANISLLTLVILLGLGIAFFFVGLRKVKKEVLK